MNKNIFCNKIKMIIWDLDDTLWRGIISEGKVELDDKKFEFIRYMNSKGIVNSICSKNDKKVAIDFLKKNEVENLFVFASINWEAKGKRIKEIIQTANLRPANVLFIDDNQANLEEAKYYCNEVMTLNIRDFEEFYVYMKSLDLEDHGERIEQYKVLEKKAKAIKKSIDNISFLKSCNIRVEIRCDCLEVVDRLLELINRTNQLNFTKKRIQKRELLSLINDKTIVSGYIIVDDDFGEYGIVGFFALSKNELIHFLFSCRIMNMGIEQWLYKKLGSPKLNVIGNVASDLYEYDEITWIHESIIELKNMNRSLNPKRILFKGPCDISQVAAFIDASKIVEEFTYVSKKNGASVFLYNHSEFIRQIESLSKHQKQQMMEEIPFIDSESFNTTLFTGDYDIVVLSLMVDYSLGIYQKKDNTYVLPLFQYTLPITDKNNYDGYKHGKYYFQGLKFDESFYEWFTDNFNFQGVISKERLVENILYIRNRLPSKTKLILLNGSEVSHNSPAEWMVHREKMHMEYNRYIENALSDIPDLYILDVNKYVKSGDDYYDTISHFKKRVYYEIAQEIVQIIGDEGEVTIKKRSCLKISEVVFVIKRIINKMLRRL